MRNTTTFFCKAPFADNKVDPKAVIGDYYPNAEDMLSMFKVANEFGDLDELVDMADLVDAVSLPAFSRL